MVRQLVIAILVAVALLGGGGLHDPAHAHASHVHDHDVAGGGQVGDFGDVEVGHTHDHPANHDGCDRCCGHMHVHCCASAAILSDGTATPAIADTGKLRIERNAALPYGQLANPPLRPPRITV